MPGSRYKFNKATGEYNSDTPTALFISKGKYTLGTFNAVKQMPESIYSHGIMLCSLYEAPAITLHIFPLRHLPW
jgi:hypothetical protein